MGSKWNTAALWIPVLLTGCSTPATLLTQYETGLDVHDGVSREFHSSLYYPKGLALQYPGYLIGIQKGDQSIVHGPKLACLAAGAPPEDCPFPNFLKAKPEYFAQEKDTRWQLGSLELMGKIRSDSKSLFVQHITRFAFEKDSDVTEPKQVEHPYPYVDSCYLYNAFESSALRSASKASSETEKPWVDLRGVIAWKDCAGAPSWEKGDIKRTEFYDNGVPAIESLGSFIAQDLRSNGYTHILILVMGWNTAQDEAIRNFNDITGNLIEAAKEGACASTECAGTGKVASNELPFRPLIIGITWPSFWTTSILAPLSFPTKAHDADELGISWLNLLANKVLPKAITDSGTAVPIPIILIGHSFGGRAVTRAVSASSALKESDGKPYSGASLAIVLEGAVSINRFEPCAGKFECAGDEGAPLRDFKKLNTKLVFTASAHDTAAGGPVFWSDPSGSIKNYDLACGSSAAWRDGVFRCLRASDISGRTASLSGMNRWVGFQICDQRNEKDCKRVGQKLTFGDQDGKAIYIDASDGITEFNTLGTGGGAHSDIYRLPMGRLLWMVVNSFAPASR